MGSYTPRSLAYRVQREDRIRTIDDIIQSYGSKKGKPITPILNVVQHRINCMCESCYTPKV